MERREKTLVIFISHGRNVNTNYFLQCAVFDNPDIDFWITGDPLPPLDNYNSYIIISDKLCGPFLPLYIDSRNWVCILTHLVRESPFAARYEPMRDLLVMNREGLMTALTLCSKEEIFSGEILQRELSPVTYLTVKKEGFHPYEIIFTEEENKCFMRWHTLPRPLYNAPQGKTLVLYTFHEYNDNVEFFLRKGYFEDPNVDFLFIVNDKNFTGELPGKTIIRDNVGHDFAAWARGIYHEDNYEKYQYFIFVNSSVRGPFVPEYYTEEWTNILTRHLIANTGIIGCTATRSLAEEKVNNGDYLKLFVQSYAFVLKKESLYELIAYGFFNKDFSSLNKRALVTECEEVMSHYLLKKGYNLDVLQNSLRSRNFLIFPYHHGKYAHINTSLQRGSPSGKDIHPFEVLFLKHNKNIDIYEDNVEWYSKV